MGGLRRNEAQSAIRQEPLGYICEYDASNNPQYQAWSEPGAATSDQVWVACKNTYDANNLLTRTQWAQDSAGRVGAFTLAATSLSTLTYV